MSQSRNADAIIIGAGIIGSATAFELAKRGYKTLNLDKLPTAGYGSTSNSCAIVRFHYSTWDGVAMAYENKDYWLNWDDYLETVDQRGTAQFIQCGSVLYKSDESDLSKHIALFDELQIPYEWWNVETLKGKFPIASPAYLPAVTLDDERFWKEKPTRNLLGAYFTPESGYINDPQLATHNLMVATEAKGGEFAFNSAVSEIRKSAGHVTGVTLKNGETIDAPIVVNAAGPHSFVINKLAGVEADMNIKTRALRHEVHHVPSPEGFDYEQLGYQVSDHTNGIYFRPETGNSILVGSEDPESDERDWIDDPDDYNQNLNTEIWKLQVYRLAKRIPDLSIPAKPSGLVDLYDVTDDWIPIYDKSDLPGYYMAVGTSGNQFKNAGGVGHLVAELIDGCENGQDHDRNPVQVVMPYSGQVLNSGFYSRNRQINEDSSFSVLG